MARGDVNRSDGAEKGGGCRGGSVVGGKRAEENVGN